VFTCVSVLDLQGFSVASFTTAVRAFLCNIAKIDQVRG